MLSSRRALIALVSLMLIACGDPRGNQRAEQRASNSTATMVAYDSLVIAENDDIYIGNPFSMLIVPDPREPRGIGELWVSDFLSNTILQFAGDGSFVRSLGSSGPGPHEFSSVGQVFLSGTEVGAIEGRRREVKWFARATGDFLRTVPFETGAIGMSPPVIHAADSLLIFPLLDAVRSTSVGVFDTRTRSWTGLGPFPEPYRRSIAQGRGAFAAFFKYVFVDALDSTSVLVAFSGVDSLYRVDHRTGRATVIGAVPRRYRRGLDGECRFAFDGPDPERATRECGAPRDIFSPVMGAWTLPGNRVAIVHTDQTAEGQPPNVVVTGTSYLTILERDTNDACVDLRIPGGADARTVFDLKNEVLYILDRRVTDVRSVLWMLQVPIPPAGKCPDAHRSGGN